MAKWFASETPEEQDRLVQAWSDAPIENDEICGMLCEVSRLQVVAYAPSPFDTEEDVIDGGDEGNPDPYAADSDIVPMNLVYAQLQQMKTLWNAGRADQNGDVGTEGYSFVPRPLDKTIRAIIRPTSGDADVF